MKKGDLDIKGKFYESTRKIKENICDDQSI